MQRRWKEEGEKMRGRWKKEAEIWKGESRRNGGKMKRKEKIERRWQEDERKMVGKSKLKRLRDETMEQIWEDGANIKGRWKNDGRRWKADGKMEDGKKMERR